MPRNDRPVFMLRLVRERPLPSDPRDYRALRMSLKRLLRRDGWRCIGAEEEEGDTTTASSEEVTDGS